MSRDTVSFAGVRERQPGEKSAFAAAFAMTTTDVIGDEFDVGSSAPVNM